MNLEIAEHTTIESLSDLVEELVTKPIKDYAKLMKGVKLNPNELEKYATWSLNGYTRNCVAHNEKFELILLCWETGQSTPIHGHGGEKCWVYFAQGEITEKRYRHDDNQGLSAIQETHAKQFDLTFMADFMGYHKLINTSEKRAMTLHLYANPIKKCAVFNEELKTFVSKEMTYDTVHHV